jgi:hypothetical protein
MHKILYFYYSDNNKSSMNKKLLAKTAFVIAYTYFTYSLSKKGMFIPYNYDKTFYRLLVQALLLISPTLPKSILNN